MSVERLPRGNGIAIRCGHGCVDGHDECTAAIMTGNVYVKVNREHAKQSGWGKASGRGKLWPRGRKPDLCPVHYRLEQARIQGLDEARRLRQAKRAQKASE